MYRVKAFYHIKMQIGSVMGEKSSRGERGGSQKRGVGGGM